MKKFIKKNFKWIILAISLLGLYFIIRTVSSKEILTIDIEGYNFIKSTFMSNTMTEILRVFTNLGGTLWLIVIAVVLLIVIKNKKIGISIALNLALAALTNHTIKNILQRPRPIGYNLIDETGYSLPSGHSMVSLAFYGFLIYLIHKKVRNKIIKWASIIALSILILGIGISRIYLGVHYTSDVIAGYLLATAYLVIYTTMIKNLANV